MSENKYFELLDCEDEYWRIDEAVNIIKGEEFEHRDLYILDSDNTIYRKEHFAKEGYYSDIYKKVSLEDVVFYEMPETYKKAIKNNLIEHIFIKLEGGCYECIVKPEFFVNWAIANNEYIINEIKQYFDYTYWKSKKTLSFDELITIAFNKFCPLPKDIKNVFLSQKLSLIAEEVSKLKEFRNKNLRTERFPNPHKLFNLPFHPHTYHKVISPTDLGYQYIASFEYGLKTIPDWKRFELSYAHSSIGAIMDNIVYDIPENNPLIEETKNNNESTNKELKMFEYWLKHDSWTLYEASKLLSNYDPRRDVFLDDTFEVDYKDNVDNYFELLKKASNTKYNFVRNKGNISPKECIAWARDKEIEIPELLKQEAIKKNWWNNEKEETATQTEKHEDETLPEHIKTLIEFIKKASKNNDITENSQQKKEDFEGWLITNCPKELKIATTNLKRLGTVIRHPELSKTGAKPQRKQ